MGHAKEKCWKLHPELVPPRLKTKIQGVEEKEEFVGGIEICAVEPICSSSSDQSYLCGNKSLEEQFSAFSYEAEIQSKYELLNDDNNKRESRGVKSVVTPPSLTRLKRSPAAV